MKIHPTLSARALASVITFCAVAGAARGATTVIGNTAINRDNTDSYSGQIFLLNANLSSVAGQKVGSWQFFNNNGAASVTPVLVENMGGGSFAVRGIGTTVNGNGSGVQGGGFGLVSGTDVIGTNYFLGYYDGSWNGSAATPGVGGVEFNSVNDAAVPEQIDSTGTIWLHSVPGTANVPANMGVGALNVLISVPVGVDDRHYSVNFTTIPEPSVAVLGGVMGLLVLRRRR